MAPEGIKLLGVLEKEQKRLTENLKQANADQFQRVQGAVVLLDELISLIRSSPELAKKPRTTQGL